LFPDLCARRLNQLALKQIMTGGVVEIAKPMLMADVKQMCQLGISMPLHPVNMSHLHRVNMSHLQDKHRVNMNLQFLEGVITMSHHVDGMPNPLWGVMGNDQSMVDLVIIGMNVIVGELLLTVMKTDLEGLIIGDVIQKRENK
jgi:hypothetical protein